RVAARLGFASTSGSGWVNYTIRKPDGSTLYSNCCNGTSSTIFVDPQTLPATGTYTILVDPSNDVIGTATVEAWDVPADVSASLTIGGGQVIAANTVRGQNVVFTFTASSGQRIVGRFGFTAASGSGWVNYTLKNPDGSTLFSSCCNGTSATISSGTLTLGQSGTFTVLADPTNDVLGTAAAQIDLAAATAVALSRVTARPVETPDQPAAAVQAPRPPAPIDWHPTRVGGRPIFDTHGAAGSAPATPPLLAAPGVTAIAGQALTLDGQPLPGVTLRIGRVSARTDSTGRFVLQGLTAGHAVMEIDGTTANTAAASFGFFEVGLNVVAGRTSVLPFPIWMTKLDTAHEVTFPSPTTSEVVLTNPDIPGLEVHLPRGTVVKDRNGKVIDRLSLTAIPVDRPPFPLPIAVDVPVYFTVQPGGAYVWPKGARIVYPNFTGLAAGTRVQFWDYDAARKGWFTYGSGTVSRDATQVVPDPGVVVWEFTGAMIDGSGFTPPADGMPPDPNGDDGDPVSLATGFFDYQKTDVVLPDTLPLVLGRRQIPRDTLSRPFGVGMTHSLDINMYSQHQYSELDLYLPGATKIHFVRTSAGTGWTDAVFKTASTSTDWYGSTVAWNGNGWDLTRKDGTVLVFGENAPLQAIRDRSGNQITLIRASGRLGPIVEAISPNGRWLQFTYDASNRITAVHDNLGRSATYTYDGAGRLSTAADLAGGVGTYHYSAAGDITSVVDARGITFVTNVFDANRRVTRQTLADGSVVQFAYVLDASGNVTETDVTGALGQVRKVTFDAAGQSITDTRAAGLPEQTTTTLTRDAASELVTSVTDGAGRRTAFTYDAMANPTGVTRLAGTPQAVTTSLTYDPKYAEVTQVLDGLGHVTTFTHDGHGNLTGVRDPLGHTTATVPNADGRPASITDALGHTIAYTYDLGDLSGLTDPLGRTTSFFADGGGRVVATANALGGRTITHYDALNEVTSVTDAAGATTTSTYDANGNPLTLTDASGHQTAYTYDQMDRAMTRTDPLGRVTLYVYDAAGQLTSLVDARGLTTAMRYDGRGRRTFTGYNAVGSGASTTYDSTLGYTYDATGRLTGVADSLDGATQFAYNDLDRVSQVTSPRGQIGYGYDAADRLVSKTIGGSTLGYTYDDANRLTAITQAGVTLVSKTYDAANRPATITLPDGVAETFSYDAASQLGSIAYALGASPLGDLSYTYDAAGRRVSTDGAWARSGLPQAMSGATYDAANQLTSWNGAAVTYDRAGNLTGDGTSTYTWDARGQLSGISGPATTASFTYDGLGRRTGLTVNAAATQFLYDGANVAQELTGGAVSATILSGATDEVFARSDGSGTRSLLTDALGSTVATADAGGAVRTSYTYEPFGGVTASGPADANPTQFTGRENDGTGLQYNRARYYSPTLQRFISQDPLGFAGGSVNTSAYAGNSPTNFTDPSGQFIPQLIGCLAGGALGAGAAWGAAKLSGRKFHWQDAILPALAGCAVGAIAGPLVAEMFGGGAAEEAAAAAASRGGIGPVLQGQAGVDQAVADIEAAGGRVLGREITMDVNGVRTRPDLFVELPNGQQAFVEVKTGGGVLTPNQATGFPGIQAGGAVPAGQNAANAGLTVGQPMGPTPVWVVHYP
ncbi:MAG TPA: RHS repeat-associated core domain-containing protein, partial [Candidatus Dormibacteraeota bacterium]